MDFNSSHKTGDSTRVKAQIRPFPLDIIDYPTVTGDSPSRATIRRKQSLCGKPAKDLERGVLESGPAVLRMQRLRGCGNELETCARPNGVILIKPLVEKSDKYRQYIEPVSRNKCGLAGYIY